jgi:uncharacterized protein
MQDKINQYNATRRHGPWIEYWFNGQLSYKGTYINGKRHGHWDFYFSNGILSSSGRYDMNKLLGLWKCFSEDGTTKERYFYANQ